MKNLSRSPQRHTFQLEKYIERINTQGKSLDDPEVEGMLNFYKTHRDAVMEKEAKPEWAENNLEYDLRSTPWILEKARTDLAYAQNLYAAMCNTEWAKNEIWPILQGKKWSCSWRYAGGIIADMREEGDYINFYCSGIATSIYDEDEIATLTPEQRENYELHQKFVSEGVVTDEIREDLKKLGWFCVESEEDT